MGGLGGFLVYLLGSFTTTLLMLTIGRVYYNTSPEETLHKSGGMFSTLFVVSWVGVALICIIFTVVQYQERIKWDSSILVRERKWFWEE